ncbi:MAG: type II toxin-antitoxin system prevent-host-death family antitoxin [Nocardioidaceae bacterium]|nr:type II toxin-antitoxin system prevent-host-death family antitoxin [Nocardioidaceae bacterium]
MPTVTGAEFNQRPSQVKRAAETEPVVITEHNRPSFVLMTYAEYQRLHNAPTNLAEWLEMETDVDFEVEQIGLGIEPAEL